MLEIFMMVINLFFVPMVSLAIHQKAVRKQNPSCKRNLIMQFCIYTVLNVLSVKAIATVLRLAFRVMIHAASGYYTLVALVTAAMLPWAVVLFRKFFSVSFRVHEKA